MKKMFEVFAWLAALTLLAFAGQSILAATNATTRVSTPATQDRGESESEPSMKHKRVRRAREGVELDPTSILRSARTIYVRPTQHLDKKYLEYKLQKYHELREWGLTLVEDASMADLVISVDKAALNYIFTLTDPRTSAIVASGKTVAINGLVAAENLGREMIEKMKRVRAASVPRDRRRRGDNEDDAEDGWSD